MATTMTKKDSNRQESKENAVATTPATAPPRSTISAVPSSEYRKPGRLMMLLCTILCILYARVVLTPHRLVPLTRYPLPGVPLPFEVVCWILRIAAGVLFGLTAAAAYVMGRMFRPPANFPSHEFLACLRKSRKATQASGQAHKIVAFLGDSFFHGTLSANIVDRLVPKVKTATATDKTKESSTLWEFANISQNTCVSQVIADHRVELVAGSYSAEPDYVIVLVGTHDARAIYRPADWGTDLQQAWKETSENMLDFSPKKKVSFSTQQYKSNIATIVQRLLETSPTRHVAVCTLPPLGEHFKVKSNQIIRQLNTAIHQVVKEQQQKSGGSRVQVLDLYETLVQMAAHPSPKKVIVDDCFSLITWGCFMHYALGMSWNTISKRNGLEVLTDTIHLNERAADAALDLMVQWIVQCEKKAIKAEDKKKTK